MSDRIYSETEILTIANRRWGIDLKRTGKEYHGACFVCGGKDRFMVFEDGGYYCRKCEITGWLDDDRKDFTPDPFAKEKAARLVAERRAERLNKSAEWADGFAAGAAWQRWHDRMTQQNREWFKRRGMDDAMIDLYGVGYIQNKTVKYHEKNGNEFLIELPCYTYPARDPHNWDRIRNVHYRIADPPEGCGKYRMEYGVIAYPFYADTSEGHDQLLIVEGANKAAVTYWNIGAVMQVMGNVGMDLCPEVVEEVKRDYKTIWIALDPDPQRKEKSRKIADKLGGARIAYLPEKPDDFFLSGGTVEQFREYFNQSRDK